MGRETSESKVTRLERHMGRRSCGSKAMRACQKMAQWGPIAEDDGLAGRKSEKGASPSTNRVEPLTHDTPTTWAFVTIRPIANARLLLSQRISGRNRAPLWHFPTPERRNSASECAATSAKAASQHQASKIRPTLRPISPHCAPHRSAKGDSSTHERCPNPHGRTSLHPTALTRTPNARENKKPALSNRLQILDGGMYETRTRDLRRDRPAL